MTCPELARSEIELLQTDGINPTLDEIAELIELGRRVESPPYRTNPLASRAPVVVGSSGLLLWPLTLQAEAWLELHSAQVGTLGAAMVCYAAHVGRTAGAFDGLHTWQTIVRAVGNWRDAQVCTAEEMLSAAQILTGDDEPEEAPGDPESKACMSELLAEVAVETGESVEYWLTHTSTDFHAAARAISRKRAAAQGAEVKDSQEDGQRLRDLLWCSERIRKRAKGN